MIRAPLDLAFFLGVHTHIQRHIKELDGWKKLETNEKGHTTKAKQKGRGSVSRLTKGRQTKGTSAYHARAVQGRAGQEKKRFLCQKKSKRRSPARRKGRVLQSTFHQKMRHTTIIDGAFFVVGRCIIWHKMCMCITRESGYELIIWICLGA